MRYITALLCLMMAVPAHAQLKAFPGAEGHGSLASGGRGGDVYIVTNLNDSGAGSLRDAINTNGTTPRTIVFAVGGTIELQSRLRINNKSNITIAGHTAPGQGIMLRDGMFQITGGSNFIVRHLRVRYGNDTGADDDAIALSNATNVIFDHVSASWGRDETLSITNAVDDITVQNCIIAEGLRDGHQYGSLINCEVPNGRITLWRNLYINQLGRTPRAASQTGEDFLFEFRNNVIYNWGADGDWGSESCVSDNERATWNMVNNVYIAGPSTTKNFFEDLLNNYAGTMLRGGSGNDSAYLSGNVIDSNRDSNLNLNAAGWSNTKGDITQLGSARAVDAYAVIGQQQSAADALASVVEQAGAIPWNRDDTDERLIEELESHGSDGAVTNDDPDFPTIASGTAPADTDKDGMPDSFETWYGSSTTVASNNAVAFSGYTALEEYLHWLLEPDSIDGGLTAGTVMSEEGTWTDEPIQLTFTWSGFGSAALPITEYEVRFGIPGTPALYGTFSTTGTSFTFNANDFPEFGGQFPDGAYRCTVRAVTSGGGKSPAAGATVNVDTTPPTFTFIAPDLDPFTGPFQMILAADEPVIGFDLGDLILSNADVSLVETAPNGDSFTLLVSPPASGPFSVGLNAAGVTDRAGNNGAAVFPFTGNFEMALEGEGAVDGEGGMLEGEGVGDGEGGVGDGEGGGEGILEGEGATDGEGVVDGAMEGSVDGEGDIDGEGIEEGEGGGEVVYFIVSNPADLTQGSYVLPLTSPADIAHARAVIADPQGTDAHIVTARIDHGGSEADYTNCDPYQPGKQWSWRVTGFLGFADNTIEIYDGWAQFVEDDVQGWIDNTNGIIGFWGYRVVAEFDGVCPAAEGEGTVDGEAELADGEGGAEGTTEAQSGEGDGAPEGATEAETVDGEGGVEGAADGEGETEGTVEGEGNVEGVVEGEGVSEGEGEGLPLGDFSADYNGNGRVDLEELLRLVQLYNAGAFQCGAGTEDGFAPGAGDVECTAHASDYAPQDWRISLSELLRLLQFYNVGGYAYCGLEAEDGFCPIS